MFQVQRGLLSRRGVAMRQVDRDRILRYGIGNPHKPESIPDFERRLNHILSDIHRNNAESERRMLLRMDIEERFTYLLRKVRGWPGPDPQPRNVWRSIGRMSFPTWKNKRQRSVYGFVENP